MFLDWPYPTIGVFWNAMLAPGKIPLWLVRSVGIPAVLDEAHTPRSEILLGWLAHSVASLVFWVAALLAVGWFWQKQRRVQSRVASSLGPFLGVGLLVAGSLAAAEPSTAEDRAKALRAVEILEKQPESEEAKEAIVWLTLWLTRVPDIRVMLCLDIIGDDERRQGFPSALVVHHGFAQAAYLIRNPGTPPASLDVFVAGVEGTLRSFQVRKQLDPALDLPLLEDLLVKQRKGQLRKYVKKRVKVCERRGR